MKNYNLKPIYSLLFLLFTLSTLAQTKELTWNYPVKPGTEKWNQLGSFTEKLIAFNIPDTILTKMSTENLVKTCLKYPWWMLITSRDNNQAGYDYLKSVFNGFGELENRKDAGNKLLNIYAKMNPGDKLGLNTLIEKGNFCYQFIFIELLISQYQILENLSSSELIQLLQTSLSMFEKKNNPEFNYSILSKSSTCLILNRIIEKNKKEEFNKLCETYPNLMNYTKTGKTDDLKLINQIYDRSNLFYKSLRP
jgi:hypothetical protein